MVNKRRVSLERGEKPRASATCPRLRALRFSRNPRLFADYPAASTRGSLSLSPWKKSDGASGKISGHFSTPLCKSRNAADYAPLLARASSKTRRKEKKKKGKRGEKKKRRKRKRKQKRWFARPLASGWTAYAYEEHKGGREGKLNVRKKVANVVKIRDRQSGALCPAGEQYRRRSGDWRIFLRIGRYCWIFQIVFLAYAAAEIARNPFARLSILLLSIFRFI